MTDENYGTQNETVDNDTPIELETEEFECEAPRSQEEENSLTPEAGGFSNVNVQLPASGQGYYSYSANRNKQYGLAKTIQAIEKIGRDWFSTHSAGPVIGVGNISLNGGGPMAPHVSHQKGLDVDFRLLRKDGAKVGVSRFEAAYSRQRTQDLVNVIRANGILTVDLILFNDSSVTGVQSWSGHDDHLHVRFR